MRAALIVAVICLMVSQAAGFDESGRGFSSSNIMEDGVKDLNYSQDKILDGTGVIIAVADTGIDMDHSCFRDSLESVGIPGSEHRKILLLNDSIDDWDNVGHYQYRHGTHIAGILACDPLDGDESMKSYSNGSKLIIQDVVGPDGWAVPPVEQLLSEGANNGAVIHSWSWGDNTVNYTERSRNIDSWMMENPWSLVFVAPGNNDGQLLEPANARNVVAVAASNSEEDGEIWGSSAFGPDSDERRGILIAAPGINIVSAKSDGNNSSMNNQSLAMTGTSMATPVAASFTAVLQQMVEERTNITPSGAQLRALLALSADPVTGASPDQYQGYGRPNMSRVAGAWMYDSFAMDNWSEFIQSRGSTIEDLKNNSWDGSGANGPFLAQNESFTVRVKPISDSDVVVTMSYNARPQPYEIDDLRLVITTDDGRFVIDDDISISGNSAMYYSHPSFDSAKEKNSTNETTVMIRIPADALDGVEWIDLEVYAKKVASGVSPGTVGVEGDRLGFALAATGIDQFPWEWTDDDGDGVINEFDQCPDTFLGAVVSSDNNGGTSSGCAIMNTAPAIVLMQAPGENENASEQISVTWAVEDQEGDDVEVVVRLISDNLTINITECGKQFTRVGLSTCTVDIPDDLILFQFNRNDWMFEIVAMDSNSSEWTSAKTSSISSSNFTIWWENPLLIDNNNLQNNSLNNSSVTANKEDNVSTATNRALLLGVIGVFAGLLFAASVMFRRFENKNLEGVPSPFVEEE